MKHIKLNKLLQEAGVHPEAIEHVMNHHNIKKSDKLTVTSSTEMVIDLEKMSIDELIELKNDIHRFINGRLDNYQREVNNPDLSKGQP